MYPLQVDHLVASMQALKPVKQAGAGRGRAFVTLVLGLLAVAAASAALPAASAVRLPETMPAISAQIPAQYSPAVVEVFTSASATVTLPPYHAAFVGAAILGGWQSDSESLYFDTDGTVQIDAAGPWYDFTTSGTTLTIHQGSSTTAFQFEVNDSLDLLTVSNGAGTTTVYARYGEPLMTAGDIPASLILVRDATGPSESSTQEAAVSGTGFIVSSDGYIVTNAHVVLADDDMAYDMLAERLAGDLIAGLAEALSDLDQAGIDTVTATFLDFVFDHIQFGSLHKDVYVFQGIAQSGEDIRTKATVADVRKAGDVLTTVGGSVSWGKDIAVLRIPKNNLPTVRLGDAATVAPGDQLFVVGYPALGAVQGVFRTETLMMPTLTQGVASAHRTLNTGENTIQTDAAINHGNSGGPIFDASGRVVAVATFGDGEGVQQIAFGLDIATAKQFTAELNVNNAPGPVDQKWAEGIRAFWERDCDTAMARMNDVLALNQEHPYARSYIDECNRAFTAGEIQHRKAAPAPVAALLAVLLVGMAAAVRAGRGRRND